MNIKPWQESRKDIDFFSDDIQIWSAFLDMEHSSSFFHLLSEDEKKRSARLKSSPIAYQQIISRGILRLLLGKYIGVDPKELVFNNNSFGKPFLSNPTDSAICFNVTHSGSLLLFAIGKGKHVGVDVEIIDEKLDFKRVSSLVFSPDEQLSLSLSINPIGYFYALWTAKEAILKAAGRGFSYPSNKFSVSILNRITFPSIIPAELTSGCSCSLFSFSPVKGYSAAVAVLQ